MTRSSSTTRTSPIAATGAASLRSALTIQLDREWARLRARPSALRAARHWRTDDVDVDRWAHRRLVSATCVDDILDLVGHRHGADGDRLLHWLVVLAETDGLALRIVLQRLLPLLIVESSRWRRSDDPVDPSDDAITAAVLAIGSYDRTSTRPHVAPRLVAAAIHEAFRKPRRRRAFTAEICVGAVPLRSARADEREQDPIVATARMLSAGAAAGVDPSLLEVVRRVARGDSALSIAADRRCTDRAVRGQRSRAVEQLREHLDDTWAEWNDPLTGLEFRRAA